jgi:hypothetical protein
MATTEEVDLAYRTRFQDQMSAGVKAATDQLKNMGATMDATEVRAQKAEKSFNSLVTSLDASARMALNKARADERLALNVARINAEVGASIQTQAEANRLIELATQKRNVEIARMERKIALQQRENQAALAFASQNNSAVQTLNSVAAANDNATRSSGRFGQAMGQAGFQIQDFATQVSMGQNALLAFGVQFAQFAGILGTGGALAGAAVMVGVIGANLLMAGDTAAEQTRRMEAHFDGLKKAAEEVKTVIAEINALFLTAAERSAQAANRQSAELAMNAQRLLDMTIQRNEGNALELTQTQQELRQAEERIARRDAEIRARTGSRVNEFQRQDESTLFPLRQRIIGLEADITRQNSRIGELNEALRRAQNAGVVGTEEYGPPAPERERNNREADRDAERMRREAEREAQQSRERQSREQDRARQEALRAEERALQERERLNKQITDDIVRYSADSFATLWSNTGRGFAGLMESMLQMVRRTFARIAAEAVIRPIVTPIVSSVVSPIMGAFGLGGGQAGGASAGGGFGLGQIFQGAGLLSNLSGGGGGLMSALGFSGMGAGISNFLAAPLFGQAALANSTNAALAALPGGMLGPAAPSSLGFGGVTVGGALGAGAAGFGAGMLTSSLVGGMRGTVGPGGMIGAGIGTGLGFLFGGPLGAVIGGAAGGGLGGLLGPTRGGMAARSGGDVFLGVDANGQLIITNSAGKRWDEGGARRDVQQQLDAINQAAAARGLTFAAPGQHAVGFGAASGSPREIQQAAFIGQLRGGTAAQQTAFGTLAGRGGTFDEAFAAADFITQAFDPLGKAAEQTSAFTTAMEALTKTYDDAITKARDLGLAETDLQAQRAVRIAKLEADRARDLDIIDRTIAARRMTLGGDTRGAGLTQFDLRAEAELRAFGDQLFNLGLERTGDEYRRRVVELEQVIADERLAVMRQYDQQVRGITQGLLESLTLGDLGGLPLEARYGAALSSLSAAQQPLLDGATPEELAEFARVAQIALPIAKEFLGVSGSFAELVADVSRTLRTAAPGTDPANLGALLEAQVAGADRLELAVIGTGQAQTEVLNSLLTELRRLTAQNEALLARATV